MNFVLVFSLRSDCWGLDVMARTCEGGKGFGSLGEWGLVRWSWGIRSEASASVILGSVQRLAPAPLQHQFLPPLRVTFAPLSPQ